MSRDGRTGIKISQRFYKNLNDWRGSLGWEEFLRAMLKSYLEMDKLGDISEIKKVQNELIKVKQQNQMMLGLMNLSHTLKR